MNLCCLELRLSEDFKEYSDTEHLDMSRNSELIYWQSLEISVSSTGEYQRITKEVDVGHIAFLH